MLELRKISKQYPGFRLDDISFAVEDGSYFVLMGPSGAGKTQLLEIVSGITTQDSGQVLADHSPIQSLPARKRPMGVLFQDLAIFPHMSVEHNITYGLKRRYASAEDKRLIQDEVERLGISNLLKRRPATLSGGELQRVALARTLVRRPRYLLLDEPLSSLDVQLRQDLFSLLKGLHQEGQTILHVTHNYEEALVLATHIGVIHKGKIIQTGTAEEVFHRPGSEFVARFTGIKNYFPASLGTRSGKKIARLKNKMEIRIISGEPDGEGYVLIPGEEIILASERFESSATNQFKATVKEVFNAPNGMEILLDAGVQFYANITKESFQTLALDPGKEVWFAFKASGVRFIRT